MTSKTIKAAVVAVVVGIAGYWYWSPLLTVRQMQSAAQAKDAQAFNAHVDYPRLRESLKGQFSAMMGNRVKPEEAGGFAALGAMLGRAVASQAVDVMVRPETVMWAMQYGQLFPQARPSGQAPGVSSGNTGSAPGTEPGEDKRTWTYERKGFDRLVAYAVDPKNPDAPSQEKFGLVFLRSGFADWKLAEFSLPAGQ